MRMTRGYTEIDNYASRVEKHCDRAKASTFLCEDNAGEGKFDDAKRHANEAIAQLEYAISELKAILPKEDSNE